MNLTSTDTGGRVYMERALRLSLLGGPRVSPNPFVGAVIVADGRIIGEGYHRRFGEAHAEVNAINSVSPADRQLLRHSQMYVTLEPCSHFGKTPPCAELIVRTGIPHVVVAAEDPFLKKHGSGIEKMRDAGIKVDVGLMEKEAREINRKFFTAHTLGRPYVLLKWAQSADGFIARADRSPVSFSTPFTKMLMHRERAMYDAILAGTGTLISDRPRLTCRLWPSRDPHSRPLKVSFDGPAIADLQEVVDETWILKKKEETLENFLHRLYADHGVISLMVEGGLATLRSFIAAKLADEIRVETAHEMLGQGIPAPNFSGLHKPLISSEQYGTNSIDRYC